MKRFSLLALVACATLGIAGVAWAQSEGDLRLMDGGGGRNGRVEVFHSGQWGTVCDDLFYDASAGVACRQLGFEDGIEAPFGTFPDGVDPIWMDNVQCAGGESRLVDCPFNGFGFHNCVHLEDVGVLCSGCPSSPMAGCTSGFGKALLTVVEKAPGKEKMTFKLAKGPALVFADLGAPLDVAEAKYSLCVYDDADALAGSISVTGTSGDCFGKPCWKQLGPSVAPKGYAYKNVGLSEDGVAVMKLKAGPAGKSTMLMKGKNRGNFGLFNLPSMAPALAGSTSATVQLHTDQAGCFTATLGTVIKNDATLFKAKN